MVDPFIEVEPNMVGNIDVEGIELVVHYEVLV